MKKVIEFLRNNIKEKDSLVVACSGGPDSMCLLDLVTLVSEIENKYQLEIPDKEIKKIQTVEDIVNFLSSHV